jgi:L-alanine-DL-glutamate epimerase-like enolase superfamily enzyme
MRLWQRVRSLAAVKITAVTPIAVTYPLERETMSFAFVRVESADGLVGYGESCDSYGCSYAGVVGAVVSDAFAPLLVGEELTAVDPLAERMRLWTRRRLGDSWVAAQARSGVEIALWDLLGRATGRSVSSLLGRVRDRVEIYASSGFLEEGDAAHHLAQLDPLLSRGVRRVKVRVGPEWQADLATMRELRSLLGPDIELMVDGSEIFTLPTALVVAEKLAALDVTWFEEPLPQGARRGIHELAQRAAVPIAYGEHLFGRDDALDALGSGITVLQPDASTSGGIGDARRMAEVATHYGARVVLHVCAGPIALAANLHLAASTANIRLIEYPPSLAGALDGLGRGHRLGIDAIADGMLAVPDAPGLGVELAEDVAIANPYRVPHRLAGVREDATRPAARAGLPDRFTGDR